MDELIDGQSVNVSWNVRAAAELVDDCNWTEDIHS